MAGDLPDVYLRFVGDDPGDYVGECTDLDHLGEDGWITIKSFNFGFGFPGKDDTTKKKKKDEKSAKDKDKDKDKETKKRPKTQGMKSGPMTFEPISFSKSSDVMSVSLMKACQKAKKIKQVELHTCRPGGTDNEEKLVFLELVFKDVHVRTCKLNLTTEGLPSEDVEFTYEEVEMTSYWTDNATGGDRLKYGPLSVSWAMKDGQVDDEESSDDE